MITSSVKDGATGYEIIRTEPTDFIDIVSTGDTCYLSREIPGGEKWGQIVPNDDKHGQALSTGKGFELIGSTRLLTKYAVGSSEVLDFAVEWNEDLGDNSDLDDNYINLDGTRYLILESEFYDCALQYLLYYRYRASTSYRYYERNLVHN